MYNVWCRRRERLYRRNRKVHFFQGSCFFLGQPYQGTGGSAGDGVYSLYTQEKICILIRNKKCVATPLVLFLFSIPLFDLLPPPFKPNSFILGHLNVVIGHFLLAIAVKTNLNGYLLVVSNRTAVNCWEKKSSFSCFPYARKLQPFRYCPQNLTVCIIKIFLLNISSSLCRVFISSKNLQYASQSR